MNQISNEVKQQIISEYIKTAAGRAKLAASMIQPLRLRRDYTAVGRKTFLVEQLPDDPTWDDLLYQIYVRQSVEAGLADERAGRVITVEEVKKRLGLPA